MSKLLEAGPAPTGPAHRTRATSGRWRPSYAAVAGLGVVFCVVPLVANSYWTFLFATFFAYALAVMGARVLFGMAGQLSLAQATFMGIGAYTAAIATTHLGLTAVYEIVLVIAATVAASLLVGLPALRVSGLRLVLLTLAFGELFQWWLREQRDLTGGPQGLAVDSLFIPGVNTGSLHFLYFLALGCAAVTTFFLARLPHTQLGRRLEAVRSSDMITLSVGAQPRVVKLIAFIIAGVLAGIAGLLLAHIDGAVSPKSFDLFSSVYIIVAVIIGGARSTAGAWIGAAFLTFVPALFSTLGYDRLYVLMAGLIMIVVIRVLPNGLVRLPALLLRKAR
jgi:branched-chain amino acid transport system permease protein